MKRILSIILLLALSLCACGQQPGEEAGPVYTDALGYQVSLPQRPERVAALLGSFADVWVLAGGSLCAAPEDAWEDFALELPEAVNIGGAHSPSLELLLSAQPELVLASASTASNVKLRETLVAAGVSVIYFDVDNFTDYLHMLDVCTDITGRKDLYAQNGLQLQQQIDQIKEQAARLPEKTVLLLRVSASSIKAKGSEGTILGEMLWDIGCVNIADSDSSLLENLSIEAVLRAQPDYIFAVTMGSDTQGAQEALDQLLQQDPAWSSLEAVKQGNVHMMEKQLFNLKPNARWGQAYEKLYEILSLQQG